MHREKQSIKELEKESSDSNKAADKLSLKLMRSGNASVSGDVTVTSIPAGSSKEYEIGRAIWNSGVLS